MTTQPTTDPMDTTRLEFSSDEALQEAERYRSAAADSYENARAHPKERTFWLDAAQSAARRSATFREYAAARERIESLTRELAEERAKCAFTIPAFDGMKRNDCPSTWTAECGCRHGRVYSCDQDAGHNGAHSAEFCSGDRIAWQTEAEAKATPPASSPSVQGMGESDGPESESDGGAMALEIFADMLGDAFYEPMDLPEIPSPSISPSDGETPRHVCGLQGFGRGLDGINDRCPACEVASTDTEVANV